MSKTAISIAAAILLIALAGFLYIIWGGQARSGSGAPPSLVAGDFSVNFEGITLAQSASDDSGFFVLTGWSLRRFDLSGRELWTRAVSHTNPLLIQGGAYVALSAHRSRIFYAFGPNGLLYTIDFEHDILSYHISANGYSAVLTTNGDSYNIDVFNASGTRLKRHTVAERNLFPISMAISPDGRILVVSYLDVSGAVISSYICAYFIRAGEAAYYTDGLFASFRQVEGEIISRVAFIDQTHLMYSSDGQFGVYELTPAPGTRHVWSRTLDSHADFIEAVYGIGVAVAFGQPLIGAESSDEGTFVIYGLNGTELATYSMDGSISYLSSGAGAVIIGGGPLRRNFAAINYRNQVVWEYTATSDVLDFILLDKPERALIVTPARIQIMESR